MCAWRMRVERGEHHAIRAALRRKLQLAAFRYEVAAAFMSLNEVEAVFDRAGIVVDFESLKLHDLAPIDGQLPMSQLNVRLEPSRTTLRRG